MPWTDRIRNAAYISPSGTAFPFLYENVRKTFDKKTTAFNFPDANGTYVQDLGHTGFRYPLRFIFSGPDYDVVSQGFEKALQETGIGKLEHPIYGVVDVVPFGTISRRDDLKTAANQAIFEIVLWETIGLIYPTSQEDPASEVVQATDEYNVASADEFEEVLVLDTAFKEVSFKNTYDVLLAAAKAGLQSIAETQDDVGQQFDNIGDSISNGIDILVDDPTTLALQTQQMVQSPSRALTNIKARLSGYSDLINSIIGNEDSVVSGNNGDFDSNDFHNKDLYVSTYVTGSVLSSVNNQFDTKREALETAESILEQFEAVTDWRDDNFEALDQIDTGGSYQKLQESVALTAGFLVQISFSLKQERTIITDRDRTFVDLVAELYGTTDINYDFFIKSNDLSGSEHIEIKRGREIVYYV